MNKIIKATCLIGSMLLTSTAVAIPISGSIGFSGAYKAEDGAGAEVGLNVATFINITSFGGINDNNTALVTGLITGDFAAEGIAATDVANYNDFSINPFAAVNGLWSIGSFSFDLTAINIDSQVANEIALSGIGVVNSTTAGLDSAVGNWTFTANNNGSTFNFSATSATASAPAPGIALLLGIGLVGIGLSRKFHTA